MGTESEKKQVASSASLHSSLSSLNETFYDAEEIKNMDQAGETNIAFQGIDLLFSNKLLEAEELLEQYHKTSAILSAGYSFVSFIKAIMSFDQDDMQTAMLRLRETEKLCNSLCARSSRFSVFKRSVLGTGGSSNEKDQAPLQEEEEIECVVIAGDTLLMQGFLLFMNQDSGYSSMLKGGYSLRKAYKCYEDAEKRINKLKKGRLSSSGGKGSKEDEEKAQRRLYELECSLHFGSGLLHLIVSLIPPKLMKIAELALGCSGNEEQGLNSLRESFDAKVTRSPFAGLILLWYYCVVSSFFPVSPEKEERRLKESERILERVLGQFPNSCLFLLMKGRYQRMTGDIEEAIDTQKLALENASSFLQMRHMCWYELGWMYMMMSEFTSAADMFRLLKEESMWSKAFYAYLSGINYAMSDDYDRAFELFEEVPALATRKFGGKAIAVERYALRKTKQLGGKSQSPGGSGGETAYKISEYECTLLVYEMIYFWNGFAVMDEESIKVIAEYLEESEEDDNCPETKFVSKMVRGGIYKALGDTDVAKDIFHDIVSNNDSIKENPHVFPFSHYELTLIYLSLSETKEASKHLSLVKKSSDYDMENRLNFMVHSVVKQLDKK
eukprot:Nk52_evm4s759 gene=Nk52_evmTU4s759